MKTALTLLLTILSFISLSQNTIEVSFSKRSRFALYGKDSLHLMIKNTLLSPVEKLYEPLDLKFTINKKTKKAYRFKNGSPFDTLNIKKIEFKDSIYTITCIEKRDEMYAEYEGQMIDCYLVIDTRKNPVNKKQPKVCYWWCWDIYMNDEPVDYCKGYVSDYVTVNLK
jgi:hypothetical protein